MKTKPRPRKAIFLEDSAAIAALEAISRRHQRPARYVVGRAILHLADHQDAAQAAALAPDLDLVPEQNR